MCEGGEEMDQTFDANLAQREGEEPVERKVVGNWFICQTITILANCPYFDPEKVGKRSNFTTCPYLCKSL